MFLVALLGIARVLMLAARSGRSNAVRLLVLPLEQRRSSGGNYRFGACVAAGAAEATTKLARRQGLKGVRLHDMRHSHATQFLQQGVHPKIVRERLGHSSVAITLDTYSHVLPGMQESAAQKVDAVLRAAIVKERARKPS